MRPTQTTRVVTLSGPALKCDKCTLVWLPKGDWDESCPACRASRAAPRAPEPEPEAMRERINELEVALRIQNDLALSRLAQANAANQIVAADWQEMKMLRAKAQAVVDAFRVDLRNGKWSDSLLEAMDNLRATLASSSSPGDDR